MKQQLVKVFFGPAAGNKPAPSHEDRLWAVSRENPDSPFSKFIGNEKPVRKLQTVAYDALGRPNHLCRELAFSVFGPASSGKTTLIRLFSETLELPFLEVSPKSLSSMDDLFQLMSLTLEKAGIPLVETANKQFTAPPMSIFLDEIHAYMDGVIQGLLKATEYNDAMLITESGRMIDMYNVNWNIATTDEGRLFDAFRTRFSPIQLSYLSKNEVAEIVSLANEDLPFEVCELVAHYNSRIPRKALEFARYMKIARPMRGEDWKDLARSLAHDEGIDEFGMHEIYLRILKALGQSPISQKRIVNIAGKKKEEVEGFIMPWLLTATEDQPPLVRVTGRGYTITEAGLAELDRRNIPHLGSEATLG